MVNSATVLNDESVINTLFGQYKEKISSINDTIWQGVSKNNAIEKSEEFVSEYRAVISTQMDNLLKAIDLYKKYKEEKDTYKRNQIKYNNALSNQDEESANNYNNKMVLAQSQMNILKLQIEIIIETICAAKIKSTSAVSSINVSDLFSQMKNLKKLPEGKSLASLYEAGYVEKVLEDIKNNSANGREAAVMSALTLIKLAADKGVKLDYTYGGSHGGVTTTEKIMRESDCSSFASYILNQGTRKNIETMTTSTIASKYANYKEEYREAKPGDLINKDNANGAHVEVIIENHPEEGYFITAEANSPSVGVQLAKTTYNQCKKEGHIAYNMDAVYDS